MEKEEAKEKEKKKKKPEITRSRAIGNNFYALGLLWRICPSLAVHQGVARFLGYFEWLFYSAFFMRHVINAMEKEESYQSILTYVIIVVIIYASMMFYENLLSGAIYPVDQTIVNKGLYRKLFRKSRNVELACFEDSDFYDKYTLAMEKADTRIISTTESLFKTIFGAIASVCAFVFMYQIENGKMYVKTGGKEYYTGEGAVYRTDGRTLTKVADGVYNYYFAGNTLFVQKAQGDGFVWSTVSLR